jgi:hypothetical protein
MLSDLQIDQVRRYLGMPVLGYVPGIVARLQHIEAESPAALSTVVNLLDEIDKVLIALSNAAPFAGRSFQASGTSSAQFFAGAQSGELRSQGRRMVLELAQLLSLPVHRDIFDTERSGFVSSQSGFI